MSYRLIMILVAAVVLMILLLRTGNAEWAIEEMNAQIDETNFVVNRGCSGTLVDVEQRLILTAAHCVGSQYETVEIEEVNPITGEVTKKTIRRVIPGVVRQLSFNGPLQVSEITYRTKLRKVDKKIDLAMLEILSEIPHKNAATFACSGPVRGEKAYVVGNPTGYLYSSVVVGIVSSIQRSYGLLNYGGNDVRDKPLLQISAGTIGGNSGGAAYNSAGEIIGVPVVAHQANEVLGFAVPLETIEPFARQFQLFKHCEKDEDEDEKG